MKKISKVFSLALLIVVASSTLPNLPAAPEWSQYHSYAEIESGLRSLESSGLAKVYSIGVSVEGRQIWAVKISDNPNVEEDEPDLLVVGLHHAREWISAEVPYYLAVNLVQNYGGDLTVKAIVDECETWIVPVVNPDGLEYSRSGVLDPETGFLSRYWRKNRRVNGDGTHGVDLSRNYDYHWGQDLDPSSENDGSPEPIEWTYWGPNAFSEPETRAIRDLITDASRDFKVVISYHSFSQLIVYPWAWTHTPAPDSSLMSLLAEDMADLIYSIHGETYTTLQGSQLYLISGELIDWTYATEGIPAITVELRPESADPWWTGFELPENQILATCEENWPAALYLIKWAGFKPWDMTGPAMWVPDGKCDMRDVALVAKFFGCLDGDGKYDSRADITGPTYLVRDGKIDMRDVALVSKHFGEV